MNQQPPNNIKTEQTDWPTCPYCGFEDPEKADESGDYIDKKCTECAKIYSVVGIRTLMTFFFSEKK
ncbi:MAG: hypothetical protein ACRBFS_19340 [Aureispira sp.]